MSLVELTRVSKIYRSLQGSDYVAVRDFSLEIQTGEFFCLLGTSGCGKTTVLNMVAGFEPVSSGDIRISGQPIRGPAADRGVVFQGDDSLYGWLTALGNVEFGLRMSGTPAAERQRKAHHYLELVGLRGQDHKHPSELSGGMKQRIQIARVLANEPKVLLMDEPFAALDAQTRLLMQEQLARIWQRTKTSVLFVTHDIDEAIILGTRVAVMRAGPAANIKATVDVKLGSHRSRTDADFMRIYAQVYEMIREEVLSGISSGAVGAQTP
jgi:NitT/TauT family transport system ATP-binding protein